MTVHDLESLAFPTTVKADLAAIRAAGGEKTGGVVPRQGAGQINAQKGRNFDTAAIRRVQALGRLKAGQMNKTEQAYAQSLEARKAAGGILWYRFEGIKLRLADNTFYSPDFVVMLADGTLECHEVKGFWQDDARVKIKVAADQYPMRFIAVKVRTRKNGGGWDTEEF